MSVIRRREFITLLGGAAARGRSRRARNSGACAVSACSRLAADDPGASGRRLPQGFSELGWIDGRNLQIEYRWADGDAEHLPQCAAELVALGRRSSLPMARLIAVGRRRRPRTIPIVFVSVCDPVGAGLVDSMARPGGNITGFTASNTLGGKWLELLKEIAPRRRAYRRFS